MLYFILIIFSRFDLYSNGSNVPKARIAMADTNDCYLVVAIKISSTKVSEIPRATIKYNMLDVFAAQRNRKP
jgi:hypothetical protein